MGKRCDSRDLHPVRVGMSQDADLNKLSVLCVYHCVPHLDVVSCMLRHREAASGSNVLEKAGTVAARDSCSGVTRYVSHKSSAA